MGESIKFAVEYNPFWRENFSGTLFSHASIAQEMYDHSTFDNWFCSQRFLKRYRYTLTSAAPGESY
jgi:monoamine oxidase